MPMRGPACTTTGRSASAARSSKGGASGRWPLKPASTTQCLAHAARAGGQQALVLHAATAAHRGQAVGGFQRPDQHPGAVALLAADEVEHQCSP